MDTITKTTGLTFGAAIEAIKQGKLAARDGWNGKGMFVFMRPEDILDIDMVINRVKSLPVSVKEYFRSQQQATVKFTAYLCMKAADNTIVNGWLASQTDMLAEDWCIL